VEHGQQRNQSSPCTRLWPIELLTSHLLRCTRKLTREGVSSKRARRQHERQSTRRAGQPLAVRAAEAALGRQQHTASKRVGVTKSPAHQIMMRVNVQGSCSCFATTLRSPLAHLLRTQGHSREVRRVARLYQCRSKDSMGGEVYAAEASVRGDWRRMARWLNEAEPSCAGRGRAWHGRSA